MCLFLCSKNMLFEERGQKIAVLKTAIPGAMSITEETLHVVQFLLTQSEKLSNLLFPAILKSMNADIKPWLQFWRLFSKA